MEKILQLLIVLQCVVTIIWSNAYLFGCHHSKSKSHQLYCYNYTALKEFKIPDEVNDLRMENTSILKAGKLFSVNLTNLQWLILGKVDELELGAFKGENNLQVIELQLNPGKELKNLRVFEDLTSLFFLKIIGQNQTCFPGNVEFPKINITSLLISSCRLEHISLNIFKNLQNLTFMNLEHNQLQTLDWKLFLNLNILKEVYLMSNPFHCDCRIKFLMNYFDKKNITWKTSYGYGSTAPTCISANNTHPSNKLFAWDKIDRQILTCTPKIILFSNSHLQDNKHERQQSPILLKCEYSGYPEPNVTLVADGKSFNERNSSYALDSVEQFPTLIYKFKKTFTIDIALLSHTGNNFTCNVENVAGKARKTIFFGSEINSSVISPQVNFVLENNFTNSKGRVAFVAFVTGIAVGVLLFAVCYSKKLARIIQKSSSSSGMETTVNFDADEDQITSVTGIIGQ